MLKLTYEAVTDTYTGAAQADNNQRFQNAGCADYPGKAKKQDDPQNILEAGEVDTHECPHLRALRRESQGENNSIRAIMVR